MRSCLKQTSKQRTPKTQAGEEAKQVRAPAIKSDDLSLGLGTHMVERTDSLKLSFDFHTDAVLTPQ